MTLELSYVLGCVWVRAVVGEHLYRLILLFSIADQLAAGVVDRDDFRVIVFHLVDDLRCVG